jgi:hypothetical protein
MDMGQSLTWRQTVGLWGGGLAAIGFIGPAVWGVWQSDKLNIVLQIFFTVFMLFALLIGLSGAYQIVSGKDREPGAGID